MTLLEKYNRMVPRYTSYPPANFFDTAFGEADARRLISDDAGRRPQSIALYVHIPFCRKVCHYCGCNTCGLGSGRQVKPYMEALRREVDMVAALMPDGIRASEIHYGGGTPNVIDADTLISFNSMMMSRFAPTADIETAIECNPAYLDRRYADRLLDAGFNRFSLGIQDFDADVLRMVNRDPSALPVDRLVRHLQGSGASVNLDFIYGLPGQTPDGFARTMERAADIRPDRLVTFSYAHVPWLKKNQTLLDASRLPSADDKLLMFERARQILGRAGYRQLGLDHFVLPDDSLSVAFEQGRLHRNFEGYCSTSDSVYAFGSSAIAQLRGGFVQNVKSVTDYISTVSGGHLPVERGISVGSEVRTVGIAIEQLMCNYRLRWDDVARAAQCSPHEARQACNAFGPQTLADMEADGILSVSPEGIDVSAEGRIFVRNIAARLDPLAGTQGKRFSTTA